MYLVQSKGLKIHFDENQFSEQVRALWPVWPQTRHKRVPLIDIRFSRFPAAVGLIDGHVRTLCPFCPQAEQIRSPSTLFFLIPTFTGCNVGHVWTLCPDFLQCEQ